MVIFSNYKYIYAGIVNNDDVGPHHTYISVTSATSQDLKSTLRLNSTAYNVSEWIFLWILNGIMLEKILALKSLLGGNPVILCLSMVFYSVLYNISFCLWSVIIE
jgi:hypothetical protein